MSTVPITRRLRVAGVAAALAAFLVVPACNDAQSGGLIGAGIGALAGQAIGGDTEATLIGAAVGGGAGYVIGNESDKDKAAKEREALRQRQQQQGSSTPR